MLYYLRIDGLHSRSVRIDRVVRSAIGLGLDWRESRKKRREFWSGTTYVRPSFNGLNGGSRPRPTSRRDRRIRVYATTERNRKFLLYNIIIQYLFYSGPIHQPSFFSGTQFTEEMSFGTQLTDSRSNERRRSKVVSFRTRPNGAARDRE